MSFSSMLIPSIILLSMLICNPNMLQRFLKIFSNRKRQGFLLSRKIRCHPQMAHGKFNLSLPTTGPFNNCNLLAFDQAAQIIKNYDDEKGRKRITLLFPLLHRDFLLGLPLIMMEKMVEHKHLEVHFSILTQTLFFQGQNLRRPN